MTTDDSELLLAHVRRAYRGALETRTDLDTTEIRRRAKDRERRRVSVLATCVAVAGLGLGGIALTLLDGGTEPTQTYVVDAATSEYFPSDTVESWIEHAHFVIVGRVVDEHENPSGGGELDDPEGHSREVTLSVVETVWEREGARPLADRLTFPAPGQMVVDGQSVDVAYRGVPRMEPGHDYLIALAWVPAKCGSGGDAQPAHWIPLGQHALIPFDEGRAGYGESEGRIVSGDKEQSRADSFERELLGSDAATVRQALDQAIAEGVTPAPEPEPSC